MRRTSLVIPEAKLFDIEPEGLTICTGTIHNRCDEIFGGGGFSVVTLEKQGHSTHETLRTQQSSQHADQFRSFFINRGCVEIINGLVRIRFHRMGSWTCIFAKLCITKHRRIFNPLQRFGMKICGETLITKYRKTFFQRQLEPVPAGDSISRPVMKILMANNAFNSLQFSICG